MKTSYSEKDVIVLLKDITGRIQAKNALEREILIQSGVHYSELLPVEYQPTEEYKKLYDEALCLHAEQTAKAAAVLAEKIWQEKAGDVTLVSLARAGTPIGILLKRYLEKKYQTEVLHYTISIIRDRGIDHNAMKYILERHRNESIQFVDGWVGKGAITKELKKAMKEYEGVSSQLAVLADPAQITRLYGTTEDFLIPSACLNAPISGLFSRTVLNEDVIGKEDFHGAVYYKEMEDIDVSYEFINTIENYFPKEIKGKMTKPLGNDKKILQHKQRCLFKVPNMKAENIEIAGEEEIETGLQEVQKIARQFGISNINHMKPGIGETTRVLLRRIPWKILVKEEAEEKYIGHILRLCKEKKVQVLRYPLKHYRACGIIKNMSDI